MKIALEPCPFCGQDGNIIIEHGKVFVECTHCGARSAWYGCAFEDRKRAYESVITAAKNAANRWNDRRQMWIGLNQNNREKEK